MEVPLRIDGLSFGYDAFVRLLLKHEPILVRRKKETAPDFSPAFRNQVLPSQKRF